MSHSNRFGTVGRPTQAYVNAFDLHWSSRAVVFHYDAIQPLWTSRNPERETKIGIAKGIELLRRLQTSVAPDLFPIPGVFDGKKNLFSFAQFQFATQNFTVPWDHDRTDRRAKMVSVKIAYVKEVRMASLQNILNGQATPQNLGSESDFAAGLNMLNLYVQAQPRLSPGNLYKGKKFFVQWSQSHAQSQAQRELDGRMSPLKLLDGFFQSVRPTIDRLIINVDVVAGVVLPEQSLVDVCARYLRINNTRDLNRISEGETQRLRQFIKGVKVTVAMPGLPPRNGSRVIRDVVHDVGRQRFDKEGIQVTVGDHFRQVYRMDIPPKTLGVLIGRHELFPITVCKVPAQLYKPKLQPDHVRNVLSFVPQNPAQRLQKITAGWHNLGHSDSEFLRGARITINSQPLTVNARILPPPAIEYGAPQQGAYPDRISLNQKPGTWDVRNRILWKPGRVRILTVVNLTGQPVSQVMNEFVRDLVKEMRNRGIYIENYNGYYIQSGNPQANIQQMLLEFMQQAGAEKSPAGVLAVCILPDSAADLYQSVKRAGDILLGVPTQCIRWSRKLETDAEGRRCNQYHNNLILKINGKIGGINHVPVSDGMDLLKQDVTMVIGADVSHPAPGSTGPSIASVVASSDVNYMQYSAQTGVQHSRLEIIEKLRNMVAETVEVFRKRNPENLLKRIVFFRDGVSEGEFETVRHQELEPLKRALEHMYRTWGAKALRPKITFIIVGKRHHFRFFPNPQEADRSGNCQAGFVVDRNIVHPVYRDFYLQSQPGLKGTSIPGHYTIIEDENFGGNADALQQIAYTLSHCYARSTRSVKIPAPVYYADLVCRRAKFHFREDVRYSDNMSSASGESHIDFYRERFQKIAPPLSTSMYFL